MTLKEPSPDGLVDELLPLLWPFKDNWERDVWGTDGGEQENVLALADLLIDDFAVRLSFIVFF